jgi:hypothetical protein
VERCIDCGALNPELVKVEHGKVCAHRRACQARQALAKGRSLSDVAEIAQQGPPRHGLLRRIFRR